MLRRLLRFSRGFLVLSCLGLYPSGCAVSVGGGNEEILHKETLGKQLLDLKAAKDRGAISEEEYQKEKEKLLKPAQK